MRFIKEQEASGLLSNLGIRAPLSQIPLLGPAFFWGKCVPNKILLTFQGNSFYSL